MKSLAAALGIIGLMTGPAFSTGGIDCVSADGKASLELSIGSLPVLAVVNAGIAVEDEHWALGGEGRSAIIVGQAFGDDDEMRIDFADPNVERVVAEIRLFSATEGTDAALAGTLRIAEVGAWAISCTGP